MKMGITSGKGIFWAEGPRSLIVLVAPFGRATGDEMGLGSSGRPPCHGVRSRTSLALGTSVSSRRCDPVHLWSKRNSEQKNCFDTKALDTVLYLSTLAN